MDVLLERRTVSRKTAGDGRLEVSRATAETLRGAGAVIELEYLGRRAAGRVESMRCSCAKAAAGEHEHHFVASELLKALPAGEVVELRMDGEGAGPSPTLRVVPG